MHMPEKPDWDKALKDLTAKPVRDRNGNLDYSAKDREIINRIIEDAKPKDAAGIFIVKHPDDRLEFLIANADRIEAMRLAAKFIQQNAATLKSQNG